jgi:hypothetical protein
MQAVRRGLVGAVGPAWGGAVRGLAPHAAPLSAASIAAVCVASTWPAASAAPPAVAARRRRLSTTVPVCAPPPPAPPSAHTGFTASADGCTLTSAAPVAGHSLTVTLPDDLEGWMELTGADTGYAGQTPPDAAPGNAAHRALTPGDALPSRPRIDVVLETGWRDGLEVQLLQQLQAPADGGDTVSAACSSRPATGGAGGAGAAQLVPLRLAGDGGGGGAGPVSATASPDDSVVDVAVSRALLRFIQTHAHRTQPPRHLPPPRLTLVLRAPSMLDVAVSCGAAVASDVTLRGKLEGDVAVSAPRGDVALDKVRGTSVLLDTGPAGALTVGSLLEAGTATLRCGSFTGAKLLGERVAISARVGPVLVDAAYVRQLGVDVAAPTDAALAAAAVAAAAVPASGAASAPATTAIRVGTLHGSARLSALHGGIDVGGLTGALDAAAPSGSVRLHVDAAKGRVSVACGGAADVTLLPPVDLPVALSSALRGPGAGTVTDAPPPPPAAAVGARGRGGRDSGKVNSGLPVGGFYDAPAAGAAGSDTRGSGSSNDGASVSGTTISGSHDGTGISGGGGDGDGVVRRHLVARSSSSSPSTSPSTSAAATATDAAGGPRLEVTAGGAVTVSVLDWVTLMQRRMGAKAAPGAGASAGGARRGTSAATA